MKTGDIIRCFDRDGDDGGWLGFAELVDDRVEKIVYLRPRLVGSIKSIDFTLYCPGE